jgi:hypothetical protein
MPQDAAPASGVSPQPAGTEVVMIRRILFTTAAAATLLAAAPALAAEGSAASTPCSCCSDGSSHATDHALRESNGKAAQRAQQPKPAEDPSIRNGSFGG